MKKLLATLLALSLILGSLFTGMVSVSAATFTPVVSEDTESYGLVPYPIETYAAVGNYKGYGNQLADYPYASIDKIGFDGTNGLKIEGEGKDIESFIRLGTGTNFLVPAIKYVLEFQVKTTVNLDETDEGYFEYGVFSAWKNENSEVHSFEEVNEWETVSYTFTPSADAESGTTGWCHVALMYNIPVGETLYFDNFALYTVTETKDESGNVTSSTVNRDVNYFDRVYSDGKYLMKEFVGTNRGSFDWYEGGKVVETAINGTAVPIAKTDIPNTNGASDIPSASKYDTVISINAGDGVNGTAGMKIGPTGKKISPRLGLGAEGEHYGTGATYFTKDTTYYLSFKAKKEGTVSDFSFEWNRSGSWTTSKVIAVDLTDEWVEYKTEITITNVECYLSGSIYKGGHNNLYLNCNVGADSYLYIDDIQFGKKGDNSFNVLYWGSFDKYIVSDVDNTALEGVEYESYPLYYSTPNTYDDIAKEIPVSDKAGTTPVTDGHLSVSELGEGVRGSYAMVLAGTGAEVKNSPVIGQNTFTIGKTYQISLKARVSENAVLTKFNAGIKKKWSWKGDTDANNNNLLSSGANLDVGLTLADSNGIADITTDWQKFTFTVDIRSGAVDAYRYLYLDYILNAGEKLYIDDVEIYEVGGDGINLFPNGTFGRIKSVAAIDAGDEIGLYSAKWLDEWDYYEGETLVNDYNFSANAMPSSLALSGKHVLAAGGIFDDSLPVSGRVGFEMTGIAPGKTYKVAFSLMLIGEVSGLTIRLTDGGSGSVNLVERKSGIAIGQGSKRYLEYGSELWQDYEFYFTSEAESIINWPSFVFNLTGEAGSGFLLDNVSVQEVLPDGSLAGNQFYCEGFEIPETEADFSSNKFWGTDVSDLSFMNNLPFAIDVMGLSSTQRPDIYADVMREDSDFAFANTVVISNKALDVIRYEAEIANELGKEIWINADTFASDNKALSTGNWRELLTAAANIVQNIAGDNFQGFYFDEPHLHYASNEEFVTITKFLRETFKKRVFAMNKHDACYENSTVNVTMTADSHAYVTDVGYWNYTLSGIATRVEAFNAAYERLNMPDMRVWFACSLGSKLEYDDNGNLKEGCTDSEEDVIAIFNTMLDGVKDNDSFGGIMLYSTADTNGYEEIKLGADGKAEYNTYRNILLSFAAELGGSVIGVEGYTVNADGVLTVSSAKTVADIVADYNAVYTNLQIKDGETVLESADSIKTGLKIFAEGKMGNTLSTAIAYENDINGDADTNVLDLVRLKKISGGLEATAEQFAAAGSTVAEGIDADNLTQYRQFLLGE